MFRETNKFNLIWLKFMFSKKATKFDKNTASGRRIWPKIDQIFTVDLTLTT